ncbi:MAG: hypothetical protein IGQ88_02640 [Gloeomargaritaceae cyanobacterium C42_A2020_066]|nr:hypothetical protein [Gloeomargaritaceae cyanobacterium C42_A2020_066]
MDIQAKKKQLIESGRSLAVYEQDPAKYALGLNAEPFYFQELVAEICAAQPDFDPDIFLFEHQVFIPSACRGQKYRNWIQQRASQP